MKMRYLILMAGLVFVSEDARAGTDTTRCAQYCATGVTCDCDWDASTNTLTINSGNFGSDAFKRAKYNIIVEGDDISWGWSAFKDSKGNITYSGNGAYFGRSAFDYSQGNITYSGSGAHFEENSFKNSGGNITYSGSDATFDVNVFAHSSANITFSGNNVSFGSWAFKDVSGDVTFSGNELEFGQYYVAGFAKASSLILSPNNMNIARSSKAKNIYCISDTSECDAALQALGSSKKTLPYSQYMESTRATAAYTPTEAAMVTKDVNNSVTFYFK